MKSLKVALLQLLPEDTLNGNRQKGWEYCRKSKEMGADIALFPEMWSVSYHIPEGIDEPNKSAYCPTANLSAHSAGWRRSLIWRLA